jgi:hypothetical protein
MVDDLLAVSQVPPEAIDSLATSLHAAQGFLDSDALEQAVRGCLPDGQLASSILRTLENLRPEGVDRTLRTLGSWREADPGNAARFPPESWTSLEGKLRRLVQEYPALERYRKAQRLASITGSRVVGVELICDARPVFDKNRERVEGMLPMTTLKLVYEKQEEDMQVVEVLLSPEMLEELIAKANKAQQKLRVLSESINQWVPQGLASVES